METGIQGKVALVTGAGRGIGRAIAVSFAQEGARVVICSRHKDQLESLAASITGAYQTECLAIPGDLTKPDDIKRIVKETVHTFGAVDILVNNTGGPPPGFFMDLTDDDWLNAFNLNLMSIVRMTREVIPLMKKQKSGRIINMVSFSIKTPVPNLILSNTIRSAIPGLAKTLADQYAADNILVNNVCPGYTHTERIEKLSKDIAEREFVTAETVKKRWIQDTPVGRMANPEEIAALVVFLASKGATYITGQTILADGGYHKGVY